MAVDRNAVIKLHKSRKSNVEIAKRLDMNRSTVWKIVKKFQRPETLLTDQVTEENGVYPSTPQKRNSRRSCRTLAIAADVSKSTMHQVLRDDLEVKPFN